MRPHHKGLALLLLTLALAGCAGTGTGGGGGGTAPANAFAGAQAVLLGELEGELSDDVPRTLMLQSLPSGQAIPDRVPLVIGTGGLTPQNLPSVLAAFRAGSPVALVSFDQTDLDALRSGMGLAGPLTPAQAQIYAADREADGDTSEIFVLDAFPEGSGTQEILEQGGVSTVQPITLPDPDDDVAQLGRTRIFSDWLLANEARDQASDELAPSARDSTANDLRKSARKSEYRVVSTFNGNVHQVVVSVWSAHEFNRDEYWFMCEESCILSALPAFQFNHQYDRGWFTDRYFLDAATPEASVQLATGDAQSAPPTTEKSGTVSNKVSFSLSGKVGFNSKVSDKPDLGGSSELAASTSWETGYSYTIKDVTIVNQSGSRTNNAAWTFEIARPFYDRVLFSFFGCVFDPKVNEVAEVGRGTFQPGMSWVWRVPPDVRRRNPDALPVDIFFKTRLGRIERQPDCKFWDRSVESRRFETRLFVPWP
ncbi:MAG: hypothetical protein AB1758_19625, partial [Candidatus Eremiobacterota bacterium]